MNQIRLHSYAKINLTLDVLGKHPNGYHDVKMIMQQISLSDIISIGWKPDPTRHDMEIQLTVSRPNLPVDPRNLAWKAAREMIIAYGSRIPVEARGEGK